MSRNLPRCKSILSRSFYQVAENFIELGNVIADIVLDALKTLLYLIAENAGSIAAMVLTTEGIVADKPEKKDAAPAMPGGMDGMY